MKKTVEQIVDEALQGETPHSAAYRSGMLAALRYRLQGVHIDIPYRPGTAEADAFFSGVDRGHFEWRTIRKAA